MKIEEDKVNLKAELSNLIKKAKMFNIATSDKGSDKHMGEIKAAMEKIEKKKDNFKNEVRKLLTIVQK
jgi:cytochrome c556